MTEAVFYTVSTPEEYEETKASVAEQRPDFGFFGPLMVSQVGQYGFVAATTQSELSETIREVKAGGWTTVGEGGLLGWVLLGGAGLAIIIAAAKLRQRR